MLILLVGLCLIGCVCLGGLLAILFPELLQPKLRNSRTHEPTRTPLRMPAVSPHGLHPARAQGALLPRGRSEAATDFGRRLRARA